MKDDIVKREVTETGVIPNFYSLLTTLYHQLTYSLSIGNVSAAYSTAKALIGILRLDDEERNKLLDEIDNVFDYDVTEYDIKVCRELEKKVTRIYIYGGGGSTGCYVVRKRSIPLAIVYFDFGTLARTRAYDYAIKLAKDLRWSFLTNFVSRKLAPLIQVELEYYRSIEVYEQQ